MSQYEIRQALSLLHVHDAVNLEKHRVGEGHDGGYVMAHDWQGVQEAVSVGIGDNVNWDLDVAQQGILVHQYDASLQAPPVSHPQFDFHSLQVTDIAGARALTLERATPACESVLKMDIDGQEWQVLDFVNEKVLTNYRQIVVEFHGLHLMVNPMLRERYARVWSKLLANHRCIHVHGNNYAGWELLFNVCVPQVIEVTYLRKDRSDFVPNTGVFPTVLDRPNNADAPDHWLGSWRWL